MQKSFSHHTEIKLELSLNLNGDQLAHHWYLLWEGRVEETCFPHQNQNISFPMLPYVALVLDQCGLLNLRFEPAVVEQGLTLIPL